MDVIEVKNLSKYFGDVHAVNKVNFTIKDREIFGFLGPNGAGKTTTIRMLTGVLKPTEGNIKIFNHYLWNDPILVKQIIGNVPELSNIYPDLTAMQNLTLIGELYGVPKKIRIKRAEKLLKQFELFEKRNFKAKKFSKGMIQRLLLSMGLISEPKILFLDEPTSGLDVQSAKIIKQLLKDYNKMGLTIFLTTHDMDVANELCDRIAIINKGNIISLDTPENLKKLFQEYQEINISFNQEVKKEDLRKINSIKELKKIQDEWRIIVYDVNQAIMEIMDFTKSNNLEIKKINTYKPHLEEVFLKIVEGDD